MDSHKHLLQLDSVGKEYGIGKANHRAVLEGLNLEVKRGETVAITGPSGSGKTTLLNLIAALDTPDAGVIRFDGRDLSELSRQELDHYRNRSIGLVFQLHHLLPQCTLLENILVPTLADRAAHRKPDMRERAEELVRRMGLWEMRDQYPSELSGGECQRTAVARALINDPDMLLADEPTGALDEENALNLVGLLTEINKSYGKTVIMVTHSMELAKKMGRVLDLRNGNLHPVAGPASPLS
jgi:lipoprotein-releasing system ATP-binding protein